MLTAILKAIGLSWTNERRQFDRYDVGSPIDVIVGDITYHCRIDNISVSGLWLEPSVDAALGSELTIRHPASGLILTGQLIGNEPHGSRISFNYPEADAVVSVWLRMIHEQQSREPRTE